MIVPVFECGGCYAPVKKGQKRCDFCGAYFAWKDKTQDGLQIPSEVCTCTCAACESARRENKVVMRHLIVAESSPVLKPYTSEDFDDTFVESFSARERKERTRIDVVIYEDDDDVSKDDFFDAGKAGLANISTLFRLTSRQDVNVVDLLKTVNDNYIKMALEKARGKMMAISPMDWYIRNVHLDNIFKEIEHSGLSSVTLYERKKLDRDVGGNPIFSFPASHKVVFAARSILDLATGKYLKADETWPWKEMKVQPASYQEKGKKRRA